MKVSGIITTFNRKGFAEKALQSVLAQTYKDFELIVLDNSSTDGTEEMVKGYSDPRIVYVKHPQLGIAAARNLGVKTAKGEFVGFLDDDDEWLPKKLELQMALFERSSKDVALVYGGFNRVRDGKIYETFTPRLRGKVFEDYFCKSDPLTGSASNPLIRRSAFDVSGLYDERLKTSEDWEFYLRLARDFEFDFVPEPILNIRSHAGPRLGDKLEEAAGVELMVCEEFKDFLASHPVCHSYYLQKIGGKYCRVGKPDEGRKYLKEAIGVSPSNTVAKIQYRLSFFGSSVYRWFHRMYQENRAR
ncbi:MAG TPA: glycosyltransferase [Candidatus Paceibacterota bacterium]|nr:glycosyltransferase [Candidatus Paceibacterota bacterium]